MHDDAACENPAITAYKDSSVHLSKISVSQLPHYKADLLSAALERSFRHHLLMEYGSGKPSWARGGGGESDVEDGGGIRTRRRSPVGGGGGTTASSSSYQQQTNNNNFNYQPPQLVDGNTYIARQTNMIEDIARTNIEVETNANNILSTLYGQRTQIQNANDNTWQMRANVVKAQRELKELQHKAFLKKQKLYIIIAVLSLVDIVLFCRIVQCGGSFFCR
jgi:hypothetical protein